MTTKCPKCNGPLVSLTSLNVKLCADCLAEYSNDLKPGQKILIKATR